jgi:hypothetical protein
MFSYRIEEENPGKDVVYFRNDFEGAVLKQVKDVGIFVKFKGCPERLANEGSGVVLDAVHDLHIDYIDAVTYYNW